MGDNKKGVVDFVLLVDATGSMQPCMDALKASLTAFLDELTGPQSIIQDWRGKVVAYRDVLHDGSVWYEDNPFVSETELLRAQVGTLRARGGGDEPESLLDALHKVAVMEVLPRGNSVSPSGSLYGVTRCVIAFTDATFHNPMSYEGGAGGGVNDVIHALHAGKIVFIAFAPDHECYEDLMAADRAEQEKLAGSDFVASMKAVAEDRAKFARVMKAFAKTISKSVAVEAL